MEDRGNERSTLHNEKKNICLWEEQNLNIDYLIVESGNSKMSINKSLGLFVASVVW
jgi:hypothetical protein